MTGTAVEGPRRSLALKIGLLILVLVTASILVTGVLAYREDRQALKEEIGERLLAIARTASIGIDGELHREIFRDDVLGDDAITIKGGQTVRVFGLPAFLRFRDHLREVKSRNGLVTDVYTFRRQAGGAPGAPVAIEFVVMSAEEPYIGNVLSSISPEQERAVEELYRTKKAVATDLYEDPEGAWISAMAPIAAHDGTVEGALEVDYKLSTFQSLLARRRRELMLFCVLGMAASFAMTGFVVRWLVRPVRALTAAMQRVGQGDLEQSVAVTTQDEIGFLARSFNTMVEGLRQRDFLKHTLKRYVAATVVDQILRDPGLVRLHGERRKVTVFFSDVEGFTTLAERTQPERVVELLNEYLGHLTDIIFDLEGTLDKYEGDAIVAFWGAPLHFEDHARRACLAALRIQERLKALRLDWERAGKPSMTTRIGLNTGDAVVGNIGCSRRMDYTAVGDPVNLGARLEGANKVYGTQILISEFTYWEVKGSFEAREVDRVTVVGRKEPIGILELVGETGSVPPERLSLLKQFQEGLMLYRDRRWAEAQGLFESCLKLDAMDAPSRVYVARCHKLLQDPPALEWDWVHHLVAK